MPKNKNERLCFYSFNPENEITERFLNPSDIYIVQGYGIEVFAQGLNSPISMIFTDNGDILVADSGLSTGYPQILMLKDNHFEIVAEGFNIPVTGINYMNGILYVSHRGFVTKILKDGTRQNIIMGLPSNGDNTNSPVTFSMDNKLYFGQGTVTNSGIVGNDNKWLTSSPLLCDYAGDYIMLNGQNYNTSNILSEAANNEIAVTGAFSPYGIANQPYETRKKYLKASGCILSSNLDGSNIEQVAWGFRNPSYLKFDNNGQLFAANNGYTATGSRPIENATDDFYLVSHGLWYGWPDYSGGEPVSLPRFRPSGGVQPTLLLKNQPNVPPTPFVSFPPNSMIRGFDFNYNSKFGPYGDVYIAEFGSMVKTTLGEPMPYAGTGHRVSKIDMKSRTINTFAINKSGFPSSLSKGGGFERPADIIFAPDGAMYVVDMGLNAFYNSDNFVPGTGVIWRIYKKELT
ncbi:PQQ-dependent sugar dehydrogenase [Anaeromicropila populeti]|uniref:Glucose/arabinose dehydrogenase, beta-propeller fold n=1 Tax=Anaeromicropila populeti TaxID=37658 RepID=A0A1I6JTL3_9FIRM|nr:hypothetical protein [Anaeromicropila populeti]SFR81870.1 Glucose/arabinose dehydrogenase, beta-propeller fold [Anaeromicropila populeti]